MRFVILDRDGVINQDCAAYIRSADEWQPVAGSIEAIADLHRAGFEIVVATNQSGLSRGMFGLDELEAMHDKMCALVEAAGGRIGGVFYCPHIPEEQCACRKPQTGLLDAVELEYGCSLAGSFFVGDSMRDIEVARRKHCTPVLVLTGSGASTREALGPDTGDVLIFDDLAAASRAIIDGR